MLFFISKAVGSLLRPATLMLIALLLAFHWHRSRPVASRRLLGGVLLLFGLLQLIPVSAWLVAPLEQRFPAPTLPDHIDGIVVLGGAVETDTATVTHAPALNESAERMTAAVALTRLHPEARLLFTGGSGKLHMEGLREADVATDLFTSLGVDRRHLLLERESRNTWENAVYSLQIAHPKSTEAWVLVTSAWHMPRAVGCFRRAGWKVIPYPVDYAAIEEDHWFDFNGDGQLHIATLALKEWVGLIAYHLLGRTDTLFPSPYVPPP
jgi:uncharacterized SAM-binding protein YcdF (DUF218 family)